MADKDPNMKGGPCIGEMVQEVHDNNQRIKEAICSLEDRITAVLNPQDNRPVSPMSDGRENTPVPRSYMSDQLASVIMEQRLRLDSIRSIIDRVEL